MTGMRDRLIHGYFGVDYHIVWDMVTSKVPVWMTLSEPYCRTRDFEGTNVVPDAARCTRSARFTLRLPLSF